MHIQIFMICRLNEKINTFEKNINKHTLPLGRVKTHDLLVGNCRSTGGNGNGYQKADTKCDPPRMLTAKRAKAKPKKANQFLVMILRLVSMACQNSMR